jgi:hypothetical protein
MLLEWQLTRKLKPFCEIDFMNYYYMLERFAFPHWISMGIILKGDYRKHMEVLVTFRNLYPQSDFRAKRISEHVATVFSTRGMPIMTAPEVLKKV